MSPETNISDQMQVISGPMFSGKTTELVRRARRMKLANWTIVVIAHAGQDRYGADENEIFTHDGDSIAVVKVECLEDARPSTDAAQAVFVDEGQFYPDLESECKRLLKAGKIVVVAGLCGDFRGDKYGQMEEVGRLGRVDKLSAVCRKGGCGRNAYFSMRTGPEMEQTVIGGSEKYEARCFRHHPVSGYVEDGEQSK